MWKADFIKAICFAGNKNYVRANLGKEMSKTSKARRFFKTKRVKSSRKYNIFSFALKTKKLRTSRKILQRSMSQRPLLFETLVESIH